MSTESISQNNRSKTSERLAPFEGLYKAYADCSQWCKEKHPPGNLSAAQIEEMLKACQRECRQYQARSPANTL
jgi:hypothetical protein